MTKRQLGTFYPPGDDRGDAFPASPWPGMSWYRTDLDEPFYYDATRSKWLGLTLFHYPFFTVNSIGAAYFLFDDDNLQGSATVGYTAPFDLCCVGLAGLDVISTTATRQVRDDGAGVASVAVASSTGTYHDMTLNSSTIAVGSIVSLYNSSGTSGASHHDAYFRRVAT